MNMIKTTLAEQAYQELRARIIDGRLSGGTRLLPNDLAADLGISPTPVKEACLRLEADGLVVTTARRGMAVRRFTEADVERLYAARILIEKGALEATFEATFEAGRIDAALKAQLSEHLEGHHAHASGTTLDDLSRALSHDRAFHSALVEAARIDLISETHARILSQTHTLFVSVPGDYARSVQEHRAIFDAIAADDAGGAVAALVAHLKRSRENTLRQVRMLAKA